MGWDWNMNWFGIGFFLFVGGFIPVLGILEYLQHCQPGIYAIWKQLMNIDNNYPLEYTCEVYLQEVIGGPFWPYAFTIAILMFLFGFWCLWRKIHQN